MSELIEIRYGEALSDDTYPYYVTIPAGMTVRQFINEWLKDKREWGYFGIADGKSIFGNPKCEYEYGKISNGSLPDDVMDKIIIRVSGSGGWTRSDFLFEVERRTDD